MKASRLGLIVLLLIAATTSMAYAQSDKILLCQQTNFSSTKFFHSFNQTTLNTTSEILQLSFNETASIYQNFTTFTEVDPVFDYLTVTADTISWSGTIRPSTNTFVYEEKTMRKTDDFSFDFDVYVDSMENNGYTVAGTLMQLSNATEDFKYIEDNNLDGLFINLMSASSSTKWYPRISRVENGVTNHNSTASNSFDVDTWYYFTAKKTGSKYSYEVYSDSLRTNRIEKRSLSGTTFTFTKYFAIANAGYGTSKDSSGYIKNLNFNEAGGGYSPSGEAYTDQLIKGELTAFNLFFNRTIPEDTLIKVYYSEDNTTYNLLSKMVPNGSYDYYRLSHLNLSSLYLKLGFYTNNSLITPSINELYISEYYAIGDDGLTFGDINWVVLIIWLVITCLGYLKETIELKIIGSIIGLIFSIMLLAEAPLIAYLIFILNIVVILWEMSNTR